MSVAHSEKPTVRATGVLIQGNRILMVKQDVTETRHWALPGGKLEFGETLERCLVREMKEETGLDVSVGDLLYVTDWFYRDIHVVHMLFLTEVVGGGTRSGEVPRTAGEPGRECVWVPLDRLEDYGFGPAFSELVRSGFPGRGSYRGDHREFFDGL